MMPLTMAKQGEMNIIRRITGKDEVRRHLAEMGFVVGEYVAVVSQMGGNVIVSVKGTRIALDRSMTSRIMV